MNNKLPVPYNPTPARLRRVAYNIIVFTMAAYVLVFSWQIFSWVGWGFFAGFVFISCLAWLLIDASGEVAYAFDRATPSPQEGWIGAEPENELPEILPHEKLENQPKAKPFNRDKYKARDVVDERTGVVADEIDPEWTAEELSKIKERNIVQPGGDDLEISN